MADLYLDPDTHDLPSGGYDLRVVRGIDNVRQRIKQKLLFFLGEWFLAEDEGMPYFTEVLIKGPNRGRVESILKSAILSVKGVVEITAFAVDFNNLTRVFILTYTVRTDESDDPLTDSVTSGA